MQALEQDQNEEGMSDDLDWNHLAPIGIENSQNEDWLLETRLSEFLEGYTHPECQTDNSTGETQARRNDE